LNDLGISVKQTEDFSEWYVQCVIKGDLVDYAPVKGFIALKPYGYAIWEIIKSNIDLELKKTGHHNGFLPILIPESLISKEKEHFSGFEPEVFWVTKSGDTELSDRLAVRPTSETIAYSMFSNWINSYRDLPLKMNFWNSALRAEIKSTKPFLRNSEFLWQEGHTAHQSEEEADAEVMSILECYKNTIEKLLSIPTIAGYKTEKEKFVGATYTTCLESLMADGKALQMATSHQLGQNFSKPFNIKYLGNDMTEHFVWQTSWGISWRVIGAVVMVHGDNKGLMLPPEIAPIQVVIVPIFREKNKAVILSKIDKISKIVELSGIRVYVDKREEYTAGWKYNEWEVKGVPIRINIGPRDIKNNTAEVVRRDTGEKKFLRINDLRFEIEHLLKEIQVNLLNSAKKKLSDNIRDSEDLESLEVILDTYGGFVSSYWCGSSNCEEKVKDKTGADIRVIPFESEQRNRLVNKKCIVCSCDAEKRVLFGRAY
jgi:prolyl-tRNA synthetase